MRTHAIDCKYRSDGECDCSYEREVPDARTNQELHQLADSDPSAVTRELAAEVLALRDALGLIDTDDGSVPHLPKGTPSRCVWHGREYGVGPVQGVRNGLVRVLNVWWYPDFVGRA